MTRKRAEKFIPIKIVAAQAQLQERIVYLRAFRKQHEQLRLMTGSTRGVKGSGIDALTDLDMEAEVQAAVSALQPSVSAGAEFV